MLSISLYLLFTQVFDNKNSDIIFKFPGDKLGKVVAKELGNTSCRIGPVVHKHPLNPVFPETFTAKIGGINKSVSSHEQNILRVKGDFLDLEELSNILDKSEDLALALNFYGVVVGGGIQEHRRHTAVDVKQRVGLEVEQAENPGKKGSLGKIAFYETVNLDYQMFEVLGFPQKGS
jgi:hypothetical protein